MEKAGVTVDVLSQEECDYRDAEQVIAFDDPIGTRVEVFFGPVLDHSPVVTPHAGRWVTGEQGLGHVVLPATDFDAAYAFYTEVLGFLPRGAIRLQAPGPARRVRFLGVNQRHHSLALCPAPPTEEPGLVHLMTEVDTLDAVGQALDRVRKLGFSISSTLGRHTNDKMVSFYVRAPGGWDLEFDTGECSSTRRTTRPRRSPPTVTGATTGPGPSRWRRSARSPSSQREHDEGPAGDHPRPGLRASRPGSCAPWSAGAWIRRGAGGHVRWRREPRSAHGRGWIGGRVLRLAGRTRRRACCLLTWGSVRDSVRDSAAAGGGR